MSCISNCVHKVTYFLQEFPLWKISLISSITRFLQNASGTMTLRLLLNFITLHIRTCTDTPVIS